MVMGDRSRRDDTLDSTGDKVLSGTYKVSGWYIRLGAIKGFVIGAILIIIGIILAVITNNYKPYIFSVVGVIVILFAWLIWLRSKSLVKGRYY